MTTQKFPTTNTIVIRQATKNDISIIARCVFAAMDILDFDTYIPDEMVIPMKNLEEAALDSTRLYSCQNSLIAEINGEPVGCIISYSGDRYASLRKRTFDILYEQSGLDLRDNPRETGPGEYYLDCMAIKPDFRRKGIGHLLMSKAIDKGKAMGVKRFTLLVEKSHSRLANYYTQLGFAPKEEMFAFGEVYVKMELKVDDSCLTSNVS